MGRESNGFEGAKRAELSRTGLREAKRSGAWSKQLVVNKFCYMSQFWAKMSYLGGCLVPLVEVTD